MHIVIISDVETQGGAAIAASRLAQSLHQAGHEVTRLVATPDGHAHEWTTHEVNLTYPLAFMSRLQWHLRTEEGRIKMTQRLVQKQLKQWLRELEPDVVNVHNLHFTFQPRWSPEVIRVCTANAPTVWTLHDMWSFTGRCVYSYECEKFVTGCDDSCPTADDYPAVAPAAVAHAWMGRRQLLQSQVGFSLTAVTPSQWLANAARKGLWKGRRIEVISYGLPLQVYRPLDRQQARTDLGIPQEDWVLLFTAQNLADPRKGWPLLKEALSRLSHWPVTLLTLGNDASPSILNQLEGVKVRSFGHIANEQRKALIYSAADLLVHPAPQDNAPLVVLEALACGTPVVGFAVGGVPELVRSNKTGWLANSVTAEALAEAIDKALTELSDGRLLRDTCRAFAESRFDGVQQARQYEALFRELLNS